MAFYAVIANPKTALMPSKSSIPVTALALVGAMSISAALFSFLSVALALAEVVVDLAELFVEVVIVVPVVVVDDDDELLVVDDDDDALVVIVVVVLLVLELLLVVELLEGLGELEEDVDGVAEVYDEVVTAEVVTAAGLVVRRASISIAGVASATRVINESRELRIMVAIILKK